MNFITKIRILSAMVVIILFSSCMAPLPSPIDVQPAPMVYKSRDYAVHRLDEKTSLTDLARFYLKDERLIWKIEDANEKNMFQKNAMVVIPLKEKNRGGIFEDGYQRIPILCYHRFETGDQSSMNTPPKIFDQQMKYLKDNGYRVISAEDLLNFLTYQRQIPQKAVLITIDDGYKSAYQTA